MNDSLELRITEREPFADGHSFEGTGAYERLVGRAHFAVDPEARAYSEIVDLDKVPRDKAGLVEYAADVCILRPLGSGNRRLFFGYGNRGNKREIQFFNDAPASNDPRALRDAGNGFLMRRGYTLVWAAWQGDLLPGDGTHAARRAGGARRRRTPHGPGADGVHRESAGISTYR